MKDSDTGVRNPRLKVMLLAACAASGVNVVVVMFAPMTRFCAANCDGVKPDGLVSWFVAIGLKLPRMETYSRLQEAGRFHYPWPALALANGIFWSEFLVGIVITWSIMTVDILQWRKTYDFSKPVRNSVDPKRVYAFLLTVIILVFWQCVLNTDFQPDRGRIPNFTTAMFSAVAVPALYVLTSFLFGLVFRMAIIRSKTRERIILHR